MLPTLYIAAVGSRKELIMPTTQLQNCSGLPLGIYMQKRKVVDKYWQQTYLNYKEVCFRRELVRSKTRFLAVTRYPGAFR